MSQQSRPVAVIFTREDTLALRLRLIAEGEGAATVACPTIADALSHAGDPGVGMLITDTSEAEHLAAWRRAGEIPVLRVGEGAAPAEGVVDVPVGAWDQIKRQIARLLQPGVRQDRAFERALTGARVLIVDDSVTYREYLRGELQREGAVARGTGKVEEVPGLLVGDQYDCVIVDLVMPGLDGASLCRRLAELRRENHQNFYILVMSSRESEDDLIRSLTAGADDFVGKSQSAAVLKSKLRAILRRKFLIDEIIEKLNP